MKKTDVSTTSNLNLPHAENKYGYYGASVEVCETENDGVEYGSVLGCNANNGNASVRTANCNNHAGNGNNNYVGSWSVNLGRKTMIHTSCPARTKINEGSAAICAQGQCDYDQLPFVEGGWKAESNAGLSHRDELYIKIRQANKKRKLKNLKSLLTDIELIHDAFDRTIARTRASKKEKQKWILKREEICLLMQSQLVNQTYFPEKPEDRYIKPRNKGGKVRHASIPKMYDRFMANVLYIVIEQKFMNMLLRNVYSGVKERSILSNDKRYCMINVIRHWVSTHQDCWAGQTDIRKFYESLSVKIVIGIMFKTIVCPFARWLLVTLFAQVKTIPIGGCLSQLMAMIAINECDREILRKFNVFYCCFGDNRLIGGKKEDVRNAMSFQMSYYEGALNLSVKGDYHMNKVCDGFTFCKYRYYKSFVSVRAEIRRRAIRAFIKGKQHYAGYKGMLLKTDSCNLRNKIETMEIINKHGMRITTQRGDKRKFKDLPDGSEIRIVEFDIVQSKHKDNDKEKFYVDITYIYIYDDKKKLYHSTEGSEEVVEAVKQLSNAGDLHRPLHIGHQGTSSYFTEFHTTKEEACELICKQLGI